MVKGYYCLDCGFKKIYEDLEIISECCEECSSIEWYDVNKLVERDEYK